jgi:hypothetical protein
MAYFLVEQGRILPGLRRQGNRSILLGLNGVSMLPTIRLLVVIST